MIRCSKYKNVSNCRQTKLECQPVFGALASTSTNLSPAIVEEQSAIKELLLRCCLFEHCLNALMLLVYEETAGRV